MLFMIIEHFKNGDPRKVGERFRERGRMMPDDVVYLNSWLDAKSMRCFQVMEAPTAESLDGWMRNWNDIVDFEVIPVTTSAEFWSTINQ